MAAAFSPEQAKLLLQKHALNTAQKLKDGKPLTPKEVEMLEGIIQAADTGENQDIRFADNQVALANALSVDRKTIQRWLKKEGNPGCAANGKYDVAAWREFARANGRRDSYGEDDADAARERAINLLLQNERLRDKILAERGELIPRAVANKIFSKLLLELKARCFSATGRFAQLAKMAPSVELASEEIRKEMVQIWKSLEDGSWRK